MAMRWRVGGVTCAACQARLAELDALFASLGLAAGAVPPSALTPAPRRGRGRPSVYGQTSEDFILSLLPAGGSLTTAQIKAVWKQAGRGGTADMSLMRMVKAGRLRRRKIRGGRGSHYRVA